MEKHRFHLKMSTELYLLLEQESRRNLCTVSEFVQQIMRKLEATVHYLDMSHDSFAFTDCDECEYDTFIAIEKGFFYQLNYLRFRFGLRSMATVLRRLLHLALERREEMEELVRKAGEWDRKAGRRRERRFDRKKHMSSKTLPFTRLLLLTPQNTPLFLEYTKYT